MRSSSNSRLKVGATKRALVQAFLLNPSRSLIPSVHTLWGLLLALFAVFRFLTYFFLYLRPPHSVLPGRPPTEALASLCLTCGGVVFVLSTEQVTFAAMRHGFADLMLFLNFAVSLVSVVFCFILALFAVQGWSLSRSASRFIRSGGLEKP